MSAQSIFGDSFRGEIAFCSSNCCSSTHNWLICDNFDDEYEYIDC